MGLGIGERLVQAREERGRTLEDAERDTRISRRYLQALEDEQFELIPAPVYARGFLRSYSQYLGLNPQELIALFPRDDYLAAGEERPRATMEKPLSGDVPSRPVWGGPRPSPASDEPREPTIGIDIGVPAGSVAVPVPARRVRSGPSPAAKPAAIAIVALLVIAAVVVLAILIANAGGGDDGNLGTGAIVPATVAPTTDTGGDGGVEGITPGIVPDVIGQPEDNARLAMQEAGYEVTIVTEANEQFPRGIVTDQAPAAGLAQEVGRGVTLIVSDGP